MKDVDWLSLPELAHSALRAVEHELVVRAVVYHVAMPAFFVGG